MTNNNASNGDKQENSSIIKYMPPQDDDLTFPKNGVRISFLDEFVEKCAGRQALKAKTTTDICEDFVKLFTKEHQLSYCEMMNTNGNSNVGVATVFISHAWKYEFLDVVDALKDHVHHNHEIIIWFDLFSNNQHKAVSLPFSWWANTFKSAIGDFKHTVIILAPWNNPIPLQRGWCLFEVYCTIITGSRFEVAQAMSERHKHQFLNDMRN